MAVRLMPAIPQGTGIASMPRDLIAEVDMERYEMWRALPEHLRKTQRVRVEGGPHDGWAWDVSLAPDLLLAPGGRYLPTLAFHVHGVYVWTADGMPHEMNEPGIEIVEHRQ